MADRDLEIALLIRSDVNRAVNDLRRFNSEARRNLDETGRSAERTTRIFRALRDTAIGLGAVAVLRELAEATVAFVRAGADAERTQARFNAMLETTGRIAEISTAGLNELIDRIADATGRSRQEIEDATSRLLTFTNIGVDQFGELIRLASGFAVITGRDLGSAVQLFGRALNDPTKAAAALADAGIRVDASMKAMLASMTETGRSAEAQKRLMQDLAARGLGSAADAHASGVYKAANDVRNAWNELLESFARTPSVQSSVQSVLNAIAGGLREAREIIAPSRERQLARLADERARAERELRDMAEIERRRALTLDERRRAEALRRRVEAINEEIEALHRLTQAENEQFRARQQAARQRAEQAKRTEQAAARSQAALEAEKKFLEEDAKAMDAVTEARYRYIVAQLKAADAARDAVDPTRAIQREINALFELHEGGFIDDDTFEERFIQLTDRLREARGEMTQTAEASDTFADQMRRNLQTAFADEIFNLITGRFDSIGEAFSNLLARMASELAASQILELLAGVFPGLRGGVNPGAALTRDILAGVQHRGGVVGSDGERRRVPALAFLGAPRLHRGGIAGLAPDEVPTILQRGELVIPRDAMRAGPAALGNLRVEIENRGTPIEAREVSFDPESMVVRIITDDVRRGGPIWSTFERTAGLRRRG